MRVQQMLECHPHGLVGCHVGDIPVFIVIRDKQQAGQPHRLRHIFLKGHAAEVFCGGLRLQYQLFDEFIFLMAMIARFLPRRFIMRSYFVLK